MPTLSPAGPLRWELRESGGRVLTSSDAILHGECQPGRPGHLRIWTTDGDPIDIELSHRGDRGPTVRSIEGFIEILPESSNLVTVQTRPDERKPPPCPVPECDLDAHFGSCPPRKGTR